MNVHIYVSSRDLHHLLSDTTHICSNQYHFFKKTDFCEISHTIHSKPYIVGLYTTVINSHLHMMYCNLIFKKPYHEAISRTFLFISVGFLLFILVQFSVYSLVPAHFHVFPGDESLGFGICFGIWVLF